MSLELKGFGHVFALASVYNLGVSLGERSFKKFIALQDRFGDYLRASSLETKNVLSILLKLNDPLSSKVKVWSDRFDKLDLRSTLLFQSRDNSSVAESALKPYYAYFGLYAFLMLIISEIVEPWQQYDCLIIFNSISFVFILWGSVKTFFLLNEKSMFSSTLRMSLIFLLVLSICFFIPDSMAAALMIFHKEEKIYNNWLCLGSVSLALSPIIVNFIFILSFYLRIKYIQWRTNMLILKYSAKIIKRFPADDVLNIP